LVITKELRPAKGHGQLLGDMHIKASLKERLTAVSSKRQVSRVHEWMKLYLSYRFARSRNGDDIVPYSEGAEVLWEAPGF